MRAGERIYKEARLEAGWQCVRHEPTFPTREGEKKMDEANVTLRMDFYFNLFSSFILIPSTKKARARGLG